MTEMGWFSTETSEDLLPFQIAISITHAIFIQDTSGLQPETLEINKA